MRRSERSTGSISDRKEDLGDPELLGDDDEGLTCSFSQPASIQSGN